jgi:gluconate kinase
MPPSLLASQLATLETGDDVTVVENTKSAAEVAADIQSLL